METMKTNDAEALFQAELVALNESLHTELDKEKGAIVLEQLKAALPEMNSENGKMAMEALFAGANGMGITSMKDVLEAFHGGGQTLETSAKARQIVLGVAEVLTRESAEIFYERFAIEDETQCAIADMSEADQIAYSAQANTLQLLTALIERPEVDIANRGSTFLGGLSGGANGWFAVRKSYESGAIAQAKETLQRGALLTSEQELHLNEMGELTLGLMRQSETRKAASKELIKMAVLGSHIAEDGWKWENIKQEVWKCASLYAVFGKVPQAMGAIGKVKKVAYYGVNAAVDIRFTNKLRMGKKAMDLANKYQRTFNHGVMTYAALAKVQQEQQIPLDSPPCFDGTFDDFELFLELHEQAV